MIRHRLSWDIEKALKMREQDGLSVHHIARILGVPYSAINSAFRSRGLYNSQKHGVDVLCKKCGERFHVALLSSEDPKKPKPRQCRKCWNKSEDMAPREEKASATNAAYHGPKIPTERFIPGLLTGFKGGCKTSENTEKNIDKKEVLTLYLKEGLSVIEIAEIYEVKPEKISTIIRLRRIKKSRIKSARRVR